MGPRGSQGVGWVRTLIWSPEDPLGSALRRVRTEEDQMTSSECLDVAALLDEHHAPETNGRIPVCHTCGARTEGPQGGHHVLQEDRVNRSTEWLDAQTRIRAIAHSQTLRGH